MIDRLNEDGVHNNIVQVFQHGWLTQNEYYIDMEFCVLNLHDFIHAGIRNKFGTTQFLDPDYQDQELQYFTLRRIMENISCGLKFIHQKGAVHRDLKPSNGKSRSLAVNESSTTLHFRQCLESDRFRTFFRRDIEKSVLNIGWSRNTRLSSTGTPQRPKSSNQEEWYLGIGMYPIRAHLRQTSLSVRFQGLRVHPQQNRVCVAWFSDLTTSENNLQTDDRGNVCRWLVGKTVCSRHSPCLFVSFGDAVGYCYSRFPTNGRRYDFWTTPDLWQRITWDHQRRNRSINPSNTCRS